MYSARKTYVTMVFEDGKLLNPRNLAFNSMVGWGKIQGSSKLKCKFGDCWWVSTPGHGGYILVTQTKLEWAKEPTIKVEEPVCGNVYVYEFEEDCDWAILEYHDYDLMVAAVADRGNRRTPDDHLHQVVIPCLERWNDWVLGVAKEKDEHGFSIVKEAA